MGCHWNKCLFMRFVFFSMSFLFSVIVLHHGEASPKIETCSCVSHPFTWVKTTILSFSTFYMNVKFGPWENLIKLSAPRFIPLIFSHMLSSFMCFCILFYHDMLYLHLSNHLLILKIILQSKFTPFTDNLGQLEDFHHTKTIVSFMGI